MSLGSTKPGSKGFPASFLAKAADAPQVTPTREIQRRGQKRSAKKEVGSSVVILGRARAMPGADRRTWFLFQLWRPEFVMHVNFQGLMKNAIARERSTQAHIMQRPIKEKS